MSQLISGFPRTDGLNVFAAEKIATGTWLVKDLNGSDQWLAWRRGQGNVIVGYGCGYLLEDGLWYAITYQLNQGLDFTEKRLIPPPNLRPCRIETTTHSFADIQIF